jgi:hypothetical protein
MRSLRTLHRGGGARRRSGQEALRRHRAAALIAALAALFALALTAGGGAAKPPKPKPRPKLTLLTTTEEGALSREAIRIRVESRRGERATVEGTFVVDGFPDDFPFQLGPKRGRLRKGEATVRFDLSQRQREVLDFAIKSCHGASVALVAKVGERKGRLSEDLRMPVDC